MKNMNIAVLFQGLLSRIVVLMLKFANFAHFIHRRLLILIDFLHSSLTVLVTSSDSSACFF